MSHPGGSSGANASNPYQRDQRDILRFMYQTSAKGSGKSYQDWMSAWRQCKTLSASVNANSMEGAFAAKKNEIGCIAVFSELLS